MQNATTINIGTDQIQYLVTQADLGLTKENVRQILEFKMPTFDEVKEYQKENNDAWNKSTYLRLKETLYLRRAYHYYEGNTTRLQRRLIRYMAIFMAMDGQISLEEYPQVMEDLEEVDIDLLDQDSARSGWWRVNRAFSNTLKNFFKYVKEATCLSSYDKISMDEWTMCCSDDERFGSERLLDVGMSDTGIYVEVTHKQARGFEALFENKIKMNNVREAFFKSLK